MKDHDGRLLNYEVRYAGMTSTDTDRDNKLKLDFYPTSGGNKPILTATPGFYYIKHEDGQEDQMAWPYIQHGLFMDTYVSIGGSQKNAGQEAEVPLGKSADIGGITVKYKDMVQSGTMGTTDAKVGAKVEVSDGNTTQELTPSISFAQNGQIVSNGAALGDGLELALVSLDAATHTATLRVQMTTPIFQIQVFHKPMTILVWLGTALMAMSGFTAAFYRRSPAPVGVVEGEEETRKSRAPRSNDLKTDPIGTTT
ncbi:MAG TPA: hypothetical protein VNI20_00645 [Fimbriimonadaceae bacterium]|nr:hypothetical protein [Fimbriimonadaceae bacterium]